MFSISGIPRWLLIRWYGPLLSMESLVCGIPLRIPLCYINSNCHGKIDGSIFLIASSSCSWKGTCMHKNHQPSYSLSRSHPLCSISWYSQYEFCNQLHSLLLVSFCNCSLIYTLECSSLQYLVVNPYFWKIFRSIKKVMEPSSIGLCLSISTSCYFHSTFFLCHLCYLICLNPYDRSP